MVSVTKRIIPELHYYAPEVRRAIRYAMQRNKPEDLEFSMEDGQASDMFSFGVILYEILFRKKIVDIEDTVDGNENVTRRGSTQDFELGLCTLVLHIL